MSARFKDIKAGIERLKPEKLIRVIDMDKDPEDYSPPVFDADNEEIVI